MPSTRRPISLVTAFLAFLLLASPCFAMISVGVLTKEKARDKYGISMHARPNGEAGIEVWIDFKKVGWLEAFTYAELRVEDENGEHMLSTRLNPAPIKLNQPADLTTVAFSVAPEHLSQCSFLIVCYKSNEGDVGYFLRVKDFLDLDNPITEDRR